MVAVLGWLLWQLPGAWRELADLARPFHAAIFVACWVAMVASLGLLWRSTVSALGQVDIDLRTTMRAQAAAWAGRYLPGKVGLMAGKIALAGRPGLDARLLAGSVLFEQFAFVAAGLGLAALLVEPDGLRVLVAPGSSAERFELAFRVVAALAAIVAGTAAILAGIRVAGRVRRLPRLMGLLALHVVPHVFCGIGLLALLPDAELRAPVGAVQAVGAMAASNVAGVLVVFAPAGLGVREVVLVGLLSPTAGTAAMVGMAALLRILATIGDIVVIIGAGIIGGFAANRRSA